MKDNVFMKAAWMLLFMTMLCGAVYMFSVTGLSQLLFPHQANGSIIEVDGKKYGCELLAQEFNDDGHLWGRVMKLEPTMFTDSDGNAVMYAVPSNASPASEEYAQLIARRVERLREANPDADMDAVPVDLVTCSGSGLDPHISPAAAEYQVPRIAAHTDFTEDEVRAIIAKYTQGRFLGLFGEERVNVLMVNLALEGIL